MVICINRNITIAVLFIHIYYLWASHLCLWNCPPTNYSWIFITFITFYHNNSYDSCVCWDTLVLVFFYCLREFCVVNCIKYRFLKSILLCDSYTITDITMHAWIHFSRYCRLHRVLKRNERHQLMLPLDTISLFALPFSIIETWLPSHSYPMLSAAIAFWMK